MQNLRGAIDRNSLDSALSAGPALWQNDTSFMYRPSLLASASRAGARLPALNDWLPTATGTTVRQLSMPRQHRPIPRRSTCCRSMLRDPDDVLRASAYGILAGNEHLDCQPRFTPRFLPGLSDPDFYARATVLGNLPDTPVKPMYRPVLASYARALADFRK